MTIRIIRSRTPVCWQVEIGAGFAWRASLVIALVLAWRRNKHP